MYTYAYCNNITSSIPSVCRMDGLPSADKLRRESVYGETAAIGIIIIRKLNGKRRFLYCCFYVGAAPTYLLYCSCLQLLYIIVYDNIWSVQSSSIWPNILYWIIWQVKYFLRWAGRLTKDGEYNNMLQPCRTVSQIWLYSP